VLEWLHTSCEEEEAKINQLESEEIRLKRVVKRFKNNNEYLKIKKIVEQRVTSILFDSKRLLRLSLVSLMESMIADPQKYSKLIYYSRSSSASNIDHHSTGYYYHIHGQQSYSSFDNFFEEYNSTLLEDAEKLYNKSTKECTEQIITEYSINSSFSHDKLFRPEKERHQQQFCYKPSNKLSLPIAISDNQAYPFKRVKRIFVKTEF
jgi:hypothetical protein